MPAQTPPTRASSLLRRNGRERSMGIQASFQAAADKVSAFRQPRPYVTLIFRVFLNTRTHCHLSKYSASRVLYANGDFPVGVSGFLLTMSVGELFEIKAVAYVGCDLTSVNQFGNGL